MKINFVTKCLFIYCSLIYRKNVVESTDTLSSTDSDSDGSTPKTTPPANLSGSSASNDQDNEDGTRTGFSSREGTPLTGSSTSEADGSSADPDNDGTDGTGNATKPGTTPNESDLKLLAINPDSAKQIEILKSKVVKIYEGVQDTYFYDVKDAKCSAVKYCDQHIWKKGDYSIDEPKYISFTTKTDIRLVICDDKRLATFHWGSDGVWTHFRTQTAVTSPSDIKFYTGDPTDSDELTELDASTYDYTYGQCAVTYTFKAEVRCTLVTCAGVKVWKMGELGVEHPISVIYYKGYGIIKICVSKEDGRKLLYKAGKWVCSEKYSQAASTKSIVMKELPESEYPNDIKLFGYDQFNKALELGKDMFTLKQYPDVKDEFLYEFYSGTKCSQVMFSDLVLWNKGDNQVFKPISINYNKKQKQIVVFDDTKGIIYDRGNDGTWKYNCTITYSSQDSVIGRLKKPDIVKQAVDTGQQTGKGPNDGKTEQLDLYDTMSPQHPEAYGCMNRIGQTCAGRDAG